MTGSNGTRKAYWLSVLLLVLLLPACGESEPTATFFGVEVPPGWSAVGEIEVLDQENLFDLVNGQADAFFAYGFEQVSLQQYEDAAGVALTVEVWQLATPADAYGLFTTSITGEAVDIGNDGDTDPGRRLVFWQDRYFVHLRARQQLEGSTMRDFAQAVSAALPSGGERPALVNQLPSDGLVERSIIFFHEEISLWGEFWLGGENLLGLSPETDGALAQYEVGGTVVRMLVVMYPEAEAASAGMAALETADVGLPLTADVRGSQLGALFGEIDAEMARTLLAQALGSQ